MKKTLSAICLLAAMPCLLGSVAAYATTVPDDSSSDSSVASTLPRPVEPSDRHVPLNGVPIAPSANNEVKFRYMDMATVKRAKGLRRAVIVVGNERHRNSCSASYRHGMRDDAPEIRRPSQHARPVIVMRPMT
ncbi:hypothetical protein [Herbaspirillum sp. alder98]|uniref:hypothetical protein n=1 Tax=Herbaspirillum sp. alder98 TaxID=2913096 RepID=UPI001CD8525C|nr:hypothetical protein [Herbaspirillum sp. alder98]MCA1323462.1 hypothetical protein [Herbaspirillum sp. alder98]